MRKTTIAAMAAALLALALPALAQHQGHDDHAAHRAAAAAGGAGAERVRDLAIPDIEVVTQDGERVRFYSDLVRGRVVAMNFTFTTCTTICPPMGAIFGRLEKVLGERAGREVHLITVSVDPVTDTPERLAAWAAKFGRTEGWTLVTGEKAEIVSLLKALEVFTPDFKDHPPVALLGNDARGEWTRANALASPAQLAEILDGLTAEPRPGAARGVATGSE
ncbi:MAG TPA: SCO family protein [Thermoanaerobaculia bacterium]